MDVPFAVLADAANVSHDGKLNLLGVFVALRSAQSPITYPKMFVVFHARADMGDKGVQHEIKIYLRDPESKVIFEVSPIFFTFPHEDPNVNPVLPLIVELTSVFFAQYGPHYFEICIDNKVSRKLELSVEPLVLRVEENAHE